MKKRFLVVFIFLCVVFLLVGCYKDKRTVLKFSSWGSQSEVAILKPLLKQFEDENKNVRVEFIHAPANYFQKLHLLFAAEVEPDVIFINNIYFPKYYEAGLLEDLTPYFSAELMNDVFFPQTVNAFWRNNRLYAIPRDVSNIVIYYNKDIFKKYNVPYPTKRWTLHQMKLDAVKLTKDTDNDGKTDIWGINRNDKMIFWLPFLMVNKGGILDNNGKLLITSNNSVGALQRYCNSVTIDKISPPDSSLAGMTHAQMFMNGKLAMYIGGRWNIPKFTEIKDFDWDVINFPSAAVKDIPADSSGWAISKSSQNKILAVKLIKFLSSEQSIKKFTESGLITPARKDIAFSKDFLNYPENKNSRAFLYAVQHSKALYLNKNMQEIEDILREALEPAFNGTKSVKYCLNNKKTIQDLCKLSKCK